MHTYTNMHTCTHMHTHAHLLPLKTIAEDIRSPERIYPFVGSKLAMTPPYRERANMSPGDLSYKRVAEKRRQIGAVSISSLDGAGGNIKKS